MTIQDNHEQTQKESFEAAESHPILNTHKVALDVVDMLNLIPAPIRKVSYRVCSPNDPVFRQEASALESEAYDKSKYGERAEGDKLFKDQYRGTTNHGVASYLGVYTPSGELAAFFNFFQHRGVIFDETMEVLNKRVELQTKPIIVISKVARHPNHSRLLYETGMPHRSLLSLTVFSLANRSRDGILIETKAQPDTQRMLQERTVRRYFPRYEVALNVPVNDEPNAPHIMLLHFPHMYVRDYVHIARGIVNSSIKTIRKRWEQ